MPCVEIKFQAKNEVGEVYAGLWLLTKALYQEKLISREIYERFTKRYSAKLVREPEPRKLSSSELKEQQKLDEKRRWFEMAKNEFFMDHRPLISGKSWREDVLAEAEKYKDELPIAAEVAQNLVIATNWCWFTDLSVALRKRMKLT